MTLVAEKGNQSIILHVRMTATKLQANILAGERCLEWKFSTLRGIPISINTLPPLKSD
jgi:hypothetical protein